MGYLEKYGAGVDRRIRRMKWAIAAGAGLLAIACSLAFLFHNVRQERQAGRFFDLLRAGNYEAAYGMWVRTESDRKGYPLEAFLQDWGRKNAEKLAVVKSRSCGSGVILTMGDGEKLWVERESLTIGFPPPADLLPRICRY